MSDNQLKAKLQELRDLYRKANASDRKLIHARAKLIQWAIKKRQPHDKFVDDVIVALT